MAQIFYFKLWNIYFLNFRLNKIINKIFLFSDCKLVVTVLGAAKTSFEWTLPIPIRSSTSKDRRLPTRTRCTGASKGNNRHNFNRNTGNRRTTTTTSQPKVKPRLTSSPENRCPIRSTLFSVTYTSNSCNNTPTIF